jgi:hypothetical protein
MFKKPYTIAGRIQYGISDPLEFLTQHDATLIARLLVHLVASIGLYIVQTAKLIHYLD